MIRALLLAGLLPLAVSTQSAATAAPDGPDLVIRVTITSAVPETAFSAQCSYDRHGAEAIEDHSGVTPATLVFQAEAVRCELTSEGPLDVTAEGPRGNRTRTATSGGRIVLSFS